MFEQTVKNHEEFGTCLFCKFESSRGGKFLLSSYEGRGGGGEGGGHLSLKTSELDLSLQAQKL